jgi:hypothetical protein
MAPYLELQSNKRSIAVKDNAKKCVGEISVIGSIYSLKVDKIN